MKEVRVSDRSFSNFIRNASAEEKEGVYGKVLGAATCRQALTVLVGALSAFDGMEEPPQGYSPKLDRLRRAYRDARKALEDGNG